MAFPSATSSFTSASGSEVLNSLGGGVGLAGMLNALGVDLTAVETKLGTGSSTAAANQILFGTGAGTSAWQSLTSAQLAAILTDETGSGGNVFANSPTIVTPTVASFTNANHDHSNSAGGGTLTHTALPVGVAVQSVSTNYSAVATGSTAIPFDDTIPQITEGVEFMTQAITPKSTTNSLMIEAVATVSMATNTPSVTMALFQDSTANALAATDSLSANIATGMVNMKLQHTMTAGTTSATTFRIRMGGDSGTITFNGQSGARRYGGITLSNIKITEYKA